MALNNDYDRGEGKDREEKSSHVSGTGVQPAAPAAAAAYLHGRESPVSTNLGNSSARQLFPSP